MGTPQASPLFQFDEDKLHKLQESLPTDLAFLRLRLRFGLPVRVQLGQRFRIVVDLVDEMGQPVSDPVALPNGVDISVVDNSNSSLTSDDQLVLTIEENGATKNAQQQQSKWIYWAALRSSTASSTSPATSSDAHVSLRVQMKQTAAVYGDSNALADDYRRLLQNFCVGSAWISDRALVLPLQVELQVASASQESNLVASSTICQRLFCPSQVRNDDEHSLLVIEENYGDAMGSHVWDASILLSFAVLQAGTLARGCNQEQAADKTKTKQSMLELGSGCGLFATVLASLQLSSGEITAIFAEKPECIERLQANLDRNDSSSSVSVLPLEWGAPLPSALRDAGVRVVFAADVLYHWAAHESLLATLDSLAEAMESPASVQVLLAHKRRGKASAANLDALAAGTFDPAAHCDNSFDCQWRHWKVEKLAVLGRVDLFRFSHRAHNAK